LQTRARGEISLMNGEGMRLGVGKSNSKFETKQSSRGAAPNADSRKG